MITPQKSNPLISRTSTVFDQAGMNDQKLAGKPSLQLGRMSRAAANGTLATATSLGSFPSGQRKLKNALSKSNPVDFFKIELTRKGKIKLNLSNRAPSGESGADITGSILNAKGQIVVLKGQKQTFRVAADSKGDTLIKSATPGTYYLRVQGSASRKTEYDLDLFVSRPGGPQPLPCGCGV